MTTYRYAVTIHDAGNICNEADNVRTILTSPDRIAPRERVEVVALAVDPLAAAVELLAEYDRPAPRPEWQRLADELRGRTFELRRGVTLTTPAEGEGAPVYVENQTAHDWETKQERRYSTTLTVYGTVRRGDRESRGSVDVTYSPGRPDMEGNETRAYWRSLTGAAVPDGARRDVAAAVLAVVEELMPPSAWPVLADEADAARRSADVMRYVHEAERAIEQAQRRVRGIR
jgi:gamma-glutamylcyclotransferase (GGCT)/AIG2-like uncharacterized protein YtfP